MGEGAYSRGEGSAMWKGNTPRATRHGQQHDKRRSTHGVPQMTTGPVSFGGLESGLNTSAIISAEMAVFEEPLNALEAQQSTLNTQISDYQTLNSQLLTLQQAGDALAVPSAYAQAFSTSSSNSSIATGTVTSGTSAGSLTLAVDQLATGSTQISAGTVAAT